MSGWTDVQIMAARAITAIEHNDPPCPECGVGALRPNCAQDSPYCHRYAVSEKLYDAIETIEQLGGLKGTKWRLKMSLFERVGPPTPEEAEALLWLHQNGGKIQSPGTIDKLAKLADRGLVRRSYCRGVETYELTDWLRQYLCDASLVPESATSQTD